MSIEVSTIGSSLQFVAFNQCFLLSALAVVVARLVEAGWRSPKLRLPNQEFDSLALHEPLHSVRTRH